MFLLDRLLLIYHCNISSILINVKTFPGYSHCVCLGGHQSSPPQQILHLGVVVGFCQHDTNLYIFGRRQSQLRNCFHQIGMCHVYKTLSLLFVNSWNSAKSPVDSSILGQVGLSWARKADECESRSKSISMFLYDLCFNISAS